MKRAGPAAIGPSIRVRTAEVSHHRSAAEFASADASPGFAGSVQGGMRNPVAEGLSSVGPGT